MRPQSILRALGAGMALGVLAFVTLATTSAPGAHPDPVRAARGAARPAAGGARVAIIRGRLNVVACGRALVTGRLAAAGAGRPVALQRRGGEGWHTIARARTAPDGAFALRFRPQEPGSAAVRVRAGAAHARAGRLNVYRRAQVSWYGPGLYGGRLGCGGTLTPGTLGVASRSLPCGSKVTLRHGGRTVRVPVVDRGPYSGDREFDLTAAAKERLRFEGTGTILVAV
jgi:rare lipoprotein A